MAGEPQGGEVLAAPPKVKMPKLEANLAVWLILFVLGGGLLALYYADVGYFPEFIWGDALTYMALMTIIGGSLLVAYGFLLFVPGVIWSEYLISDRQLFQVLKMGARDWEPCVFSVTKRILFPFALFMTSCHCLLYLLDKNKGWSAGLVAAGAAASLVTVSSLLGRDFLEVLLRAAEGKSALFDTPWLWRHRLLVGLFHTPLLILSIERAFSCPDKLWNHPYFLWPAALLPLMGFLGFLVDRESVPAQPNQPPNRSDQAAPRSNQNPDKLLLLVGFLSLFFGRPKNEPAPSDPDASGTNPIPDKWSLICRAILAFVSAALLGLAALWFFYRIYSSGETSGASGTETEVISGGLLAICTLVVVLANLIVSVLYRKHPYTALLASFLGALVLLVAGQLLPQEKLPARIMEKFGFGVPNVTLVLTEKGGRILCQYDIPVKLQKRAQPQGATAGSGQTDDFCAWEETTGGSEKSKEPQEEETTRSSEEKSKESQKEVLARAEGMMILSRLGSEYLLCFGKEKRTIILLKREVVSWSVSTPPNPQ
jgi:hypothetical protein